MGRNAEGRFTDLVREHSRHRSISDLGRAIGEPNLAEKLRHHRRRRQLPDGPLLRNIADALDPVGRSLLVSALAWDARLPGYDGDDPDLLVRMGRAIRGLDYRDRRILIDLLGLEGVHPDDW